MFFVVGTGRCGTTSVARLLDQAPNCRCVHEWNPALIREGAEHLYGKLSEAKLSQMLRATRPETVDGKIFGESNHQLGLFIPVLRKVFPDARFVWVTRDGRDTVASMYARNWYAGNTFLLNATAWERWRLRGDGVGAMSTWQWRTLFRFERCCWHWAYVNELIASSLNAADCPWIHIRLEEFSDKAEELFDFLELERPAKMELPHSNKADGRAGYMPPNWQQWRADQAAQFVHFCGASMDKWYPHWRTEVGETWGAATDLAGAGLSLRRAAQVVASPYTGHIGPIDNLNDYVRQKGKDILPAGIQSQLRKVLPPRK
ncbi:MAG: sulfotransferase [Litorilinea sp.]